MPYPTKKLTDLLETCDAGVWGKPATKNSGIFVLRSTNLTNDGHLNFSNIAERHIEGNVDKLKLSDGDILVEKSGGGPGQPVGRVAYFKAPDNNIYSFANFIQRLRTKSYLINSRFLFYRLLFLHKTGFTKKLQSQTTGIQNLKMSLYLKAEIPLPPLSIQKQIVERLDKITEAQKLNDGLISKTDELFQSLLHKELDPTGKNWEAKKLGDIAKTSSGGTPLKGNSEYYNDGNIPWLRSGEISQGLIYKSELFITERGLKHSSVKIFPIDTVLVAMYGATVGQIGLLKFESSTNQAVCGIFPSNKFISEYLYYFLKTKTKYLIQISAGGAQPNISQTIIRNLNIPLPSLKIQKQIVAKLSAVQDYKKQLLEQRTKLKELFDSVLHKSMSGEMDK